MSLQHFILGLLEERAESGYDLNKRFQRSIQHFWTTEQSQIYRALHKLYDADMVEIEHISQEGSPDKKIYSITDVGRNELLRWLKSPIIDNPVRETWLGQLFFGGNLSVAENIESLQQARAEVEARYVSMMETQTLLDQLDLETIPYKLRMHLLTLDYGLRLHEFLLNWLDSAIERVQKINENNQ